MSCYICESNICVPSFHSLEEQKYFEKAKEAYEKYLEILKECRNNYNNRYEDE